jgi:hypothetical protein
MKIHLFLIEFLFAVAAVSSAETDDPRERVPTLTASRPRRHQNSIHP